MVQDYKVMRQEVDSLQTLIDTFKHFRYTIKSTDNIYSTTCKDCNSKILIGLKENKAKYRCTNCSNSYYNVITLTMREKGFKTATEALEYVCNINNIKYTKYTKEEENKVLDLEQEKYKRILKYYKEYSKTLKRDYLENEKLKKAYEEATNNIINKENYNSVELINWATYKADEVYSVETKLSEDIRGVENAINLMIEGKRVALFAGTGSGKSYSVINTVRDRKEKFLFVLPNSANVEQVMKEYKIKGAYGDLDVELAISHIKDGGIAVITWDKLEKLYKEDFNFKDTYIILDEANEIYTNLYRKKALKIIDLVLDKFKGRLDITATPNKLDFNIYDRIIEYKQLKATNYNVKLYNKMDKQIILDIITNAPKGSKMAIFQDSITNLEFIANKLQGVKKCGLVSSKNKKDNPIYKHIMEDSSIGDYEVLLNTSTIVAGVNIYDKNITDIILVDVKDISIIKQYIARFRDLESVNVHIFNNYKQEQDNISNLEYVIRRRLETAEKSALENNYEMMFSDGGYYEAGASIRGLESIGDVYRDTKTDTYRANRMVIRGTEYSNYYKTRTIEQHKVLLEEYFKVEIVDLLKSDEAVWEILEPDEKTLDDEFSYYLKSIKEKYTSEIDYLIDLENNYYIKTNKSLLTGLIEILEDNIDKDLNSYLVRNKIVLKDHLKDLESYKLDRFIKQVENKTISFIEVYTSLILNNYSMELALRLAQKSDDYRKKLYDKINVLTYLEAKKTVPFIINSKLLENRIMDYMLEYLEGKEDHLYRKENLELLTKELNKKIRGAKLKSTDVKKILESIVEVVHKHKGGTNSNFINSAKIEVKLDKNKKAKRIDASLIKGLYSIEALKKEYGLTPTDNTIENMIKNNINKKLITLNEDDLKYLKKYPDKANELNLKKRNEYMKWEKIFDEAYKKAK